MGYKNGMKWVTRIDLICETNYTLSITAEYLEAQFKIVTMHDILNVEKNMKKMAAIHEIEENLGSLSEIQ